jgi:DNA invertase Pin-like site-specific DNA recombinase
MKKAVIYTRVSGEPGLDRDGQREKLLAKFGKEYKIVGEGHDVGERHKHGQDRLGLKKLLEDAAKGQFDVLLCTDASRLLRSISPEIMTAIREAKVQIVTIDGAENGNAEFLTHTITNHVVAQAMKTFKEQQSERIKRGIRAARERRMDAAAAQADSNSR